MESFLCCSYIFFVFSFPFSDLPPTRSLFKISPSPPSSLCDCRLPRSLFLQLFLSRLPFPFLPPSKDAEVAYSVDLFPFCYQNGILGPLSEVFLALTYPSNPTLFFLLSFLTGDKRPLSLPLHEALSPIDPDTTLDAFQLPLYKKREHLPPPSLFFPVMFVPLALKIMALPFH